MTDAIGGKRVIHVCATAQSLFQFRLPLLKRHAARFARTVVYCPEQAPHSDLLRAEGLEVVAGPITNRPRPWTPLEVSRLYRFLRRERFDALIGHQPMGSLVGLSAAVLARVPVRIYSTGGLRFVPDRKDIWNRLIGSGERRLMRAADLVLLVNREDEELLRKDPRTRDKACWVGPRGGCGIDTRRFHPGRRRELHAPARQELAAVSGEFLLGYSGRVVWEKGFAELIDAASRLVGDPRMPPFRVVLLGEGKDLAAVRARVERLGLGPRFAFLGYRLDIEYWLAGLDLFVLPSRREGLPMALAEAMALGLPAVATSVRGCRELLAGGEGGLLVPHGDAGALAAAILAVATRADRGEALGRQGASRVAASYGEGALLERTVAIIEAAIRARDGP